MSESTALAVRQVTPDLWKMIDAIAPTMYASRLFGVASKEQAAAIMLKGYELGFPLSTAFEYIHIVQGKPSLSPRGALALVLQSGKLETMEIQDKPDACIVTMKRRGGPAYSLTWSIEDARRAGLVKSGGAWETYGPNLCRWRAVGYVIDVLFPDVCGGLKRADEFGAMVNEAGDVIDGTWAEAGTVSPPAANGATSTPAGAVVTLDDLVQRYGADAVLDANDGRIPGYPEEIAAVATKLSAVSD